MRGWRTFLSSIVRRLYGALRYAALPPPPLAQVLCIAADRDRVALRLLGQPDATARTGPPPRQTPTNPTLLPTNLTL